MMNQLSVSGHAFIKSEIARSKVAVGHPREIEFDHIARLIKTVAKEIKVKSKNLIARILKTRSSFEAIASAAVIFSAAATAMVSIEHAGFYGAAFGAVLGHLVIHNSDRLADTAKNSVNFQ